MGVRLDLWLVIIGLGNIFSENVIGIPAALRDARVFYFALHITFVLHTEMGTRKFFSYEPPSGRSFLALQTLIPPPVNLGEA